MVGLDAAGKTTILYKLKLGEIVTTIPTIGKTYPKSRTHYQASTLRLSSTKTFRLQYGMSEDRTRFVHCGGIVSRTQANTS